MLTLGIETSCDETAAAVVCSGEKIYSNVIKSQILTHMPYGGVVPEVASREHIQAIPHVINEAIEQADCSLSSIDLIAVTRGPGLIGPLLIGLNTAKSLALALNKPLIGVNHIEAHLYAGFMGRLKEVSFPILGVVLSGGHTSLVLIKKIGEYQFIGGTQDDAMGEAFDKVASLIGLPYPGGPELETLAKDGDPTYFKFKSPSIKNHPYHFSFSGIKTQVLYRIKGQNANKHSPLLISDEEKAHLAASFQKTVFENLCDKLELVTKDFNLNSIVFGGGVTFNQTLKRLIFDKFEHLKIYWPQSDLCLDNAAMIAGLGYQKFIHQGYGDTLDLQALPRIPFA